MNSAAIRILIEKGLDAEAIAEVAEALEARPQRSSGAERQARYRAKKKVERNESNVTRNVTDNKKEKSPHTPLKEKNKTPLNPPKRGECHKPDDVSEEVWGDFCKHRKTKRASVTETALAGIRREAEKAGWTMQDALAELVMRGWQGFNADWVEKRTSSSGRPRDPEAGKLLRAYQAGEIGFDEFNRRRAESKRGSATGPPRPIGEVISQAANGNS